MPPPPPRAPTAVRFPTRINLVGEVDPGHVADVVSDKLSLQLGRAFDATQALGTPRLASATITWTGAQPSPEYRAGTETAVLSKVTDSVRVQQGTRPVGKAQAKAAPAKPKPHKRPLPPSYAWHAFAKAGDDEFQYAFAAALGVRWESEVPDAYAVMFRLAGTAGIHLWFVVGRSYVVQWTLTDPNFLPGGADKPSNIDAGTGQFELDLVPDGAEQYKKLGIDEASHQLAGLKPGVTLVPDAEIALRAHETEARKAVEAYMAKNKDGFAAFYKLHAAHSKWRLLPASTDTVAALGNRAHFDVVCLVDLVTADQADALDDDEAELGGDSLLAKVPEGSGNGTGTGSGQADSGGGTGSDVTAEPGEGGHGGRGKVIADTYKEGGSMFPGGPPVPGADPFVLTCEPYDGEPPLERLGAAGEQMKQLIAQIAARLDMPTCNYPAHFCMTAFSMMMVRRTQVAARFSLTEKGFIEPMFVSERDHNGAFTFRAVPSVAIQYLQHLAATVPLIRRLIDLVHENSPRHVEYTGWYLSFLGKVSDLGVQACGDIYYNACQICLHQLLNASRDAVEDRQRRGDGYVKMFTVLLKSQLANQMELILLSNALSSFSEVVGDRRGDAAFTYFKYYQGMVAQVQNNVSMVVVLYQHGDDRDLALQLKDATHYVFRRVAQAKTAVAGVGEIVETDTGAWAIRATNGQLHTLADLQQAIALRRQVVAGIDPLLSQLTHEFVPALQPLLDDETKIPGFVAGLLQSMLDKNADVTADNLSDIKYAFEHGQIHRVSTDPDDPPAMRIPTVAGGRFILSGIHAIAHELVGHSFTGDRYYEFVLDHLLGHELASKELRDDLVFFGTIALSVICPPLGAAVGVIAGLVTGAIDYHHAKQQEQIYGALINPDDVLSYAEIQVDILAAKIGIGLSFLAAIPEVGSAIKGISAAGKELAKEGIEVTARKVAQHAIQEQLKKVGEVCAKNFLIGVARELAVQTVMQKVMEKAITPFIENEVKALAEQSGDHPDNRETAGDVKDLIDDQPDDFDDDDDFDEDDDEDEP